MNALLSPRTVVLALSISLVSLGSVLTAAPAGAAVTVPGAPTKVKAVGVNTAIDVSWKAPLSTGGSPITGYVATAKIGTSFKTTCTTTAKSCSITGLTNGTKYSIKIYATNAKGKGSTSAALKIQPSTTQNCSFFGPYANLQSCNLAGAGIPADADLSNANLTNANLSGVNLTGANLTDANLTSADVNGVNLNGADLTNAVLTGVQSGSVTGTPAALPTNWQLVNGYLLGPGANLTNAVLTGANLANADLANANFTGANLNTAIAGGANFTSAIWANTTCPDGTNSNNDGGTCANHVCLSHSDGVGQTYDSCVPLGTYTSVTAIEAADAFAASVGLSAADVSDGWTCEANPSVEAAGISTDGVNAIDYLWVYSGNEKGWVIPVSNCVVEVGTWN